MLHNVTPRLPRRAWAPLALAACTLLGLGACRSGRPPVRWPHVENPPPEAIEETPPPELLLTRADYWEELGGGVLEEHLIAGTQPDARRAEELLRGRHALLESSVPEAVRFELFLYDSLGRAAAEQGLWCALLEAERGSEPLIQVDADYLALASQPAGVRFGLDESARIEIWGRLVSAERAARTEAAAAHPGAGELLLQLQLEERRLAEARADLRRSYRLSDEELTELRLEAVRRKWPMPAVVEPAVVETEPTEPVDP